MLVRKVSINFTYRSPALLAGRRLRSLLAREVSEGLKQKKTNKNNKEKVIRFINKEKLVRFITQQRGLTIAVTRRASLCENESFRELTGQTKQTVNRG